MSRAHPVVVREVAPASRRRGRLATRDRRRPTMFLRSAMMTLLSAVTLFSTACQEDLASTDGEADPSLIESSPAAELELAEEDASAPSLYSVLTFTLDEGDSTEVNSAGFGTTSIKAKNSSN